MDPDTSCEQGTVQAGDASIMVWGVFTWHVNTAHTSCTPKMMGYSSKIIHPYWLELNCGAFWRLSTTHSTNMGQHGPTWAQSVIYGIWWWVYSYTRSCIYKYQGAVNSYQNGMAQLFSRGLLISYGINELPHYDFDTSM